MKIAFGSVVYKEAFLFHKEFIKSLNEQSNENFDVLLINDNLNYSELGMLKNQLKKKVFFFSRQFYKKPTQLRTELISIAIKNNYDLLILGDFDDAFSSNRVHEIKKQFDGKYSFFYNNLCYLENKEKYFRLLPSFTMKPEDILEYNYLGLSNTALNLGKLDINFLKVLKDSPEIVFDWFLYSVFLNFGLTGKMIDDCCTYYRIHDKNIAGELKHDRDEIYKELDIKINHYNKLKYLNTQYQEMLNYYINLKNEIINHKLDVMKLLTLENVCDFWWGRVNSKQINQNRDVLFEKLNKI